MKVLVLSVAAWDDTNSLGNTLSNWFGDSPFEFKCIYGRDASPNTKCCSDFLSVSPLSIMGNLFSPSKMSRIIDTNKEVRVSANETKEVDAVRKYSGFKRRAALFVAEALYLSNIWFTDKVKKYVTDYNPDIVFLFSIPDAFLYTLVKFIRENTKAKIVQFVADDVYGAVSASTALMDRIRKKRYPEFLKMADKVYGASQEMCSVYHDTFGVDIHPLYKGCQLCEPRQSVHSPVKIVYAGNLLWGRLDTLIRLAEAIKKVNEKGQKYFLEIYSGTYVDDATLCKINIPDCSHFCGKLPYEEIKGKLQDADIVLHVESFYQKQIDIVRYSFSTKIIDCLQSGSTMMVVGPKGIASVEYPRKIEGAIIIDDLDRIAEVLEEAVKDPADFIKRAASINAYAKKNHSIEVVRDNLRRDFIELVGESKKG